MKEQIFTYHWYELFVLVFVKSMYNNFLTNAKTLPFLRGFKNEAHRFHLEPFMASRIAVRHNDLYQNSSLVVIKIIVDLKYSFQTAFKPP